MTLTVTSTPTVESKNLVVSPDLTKTELASGATWLMEKSEVVRCWIKDGLPKDDIRTEARKVIGELKFNGDYHDMCDKKCRVHGMTEFDYVYQLMQHMADTMTPAN